MRLIHGRAAERLARLALALLALFAATTPALAQDAPFAPTRFSVEVSGEGPDVIFIPGLSTPRDVWTPFAAAIASRHRVHLVQVRGFGEPAGANAEGPILAPLVEELARYIEANGLERPAVVGHSLGGLVALMLGIEHSALPGRLMIVDAFPWYGVIAGRPGAELTPAMIEPQARMIRDGLVASHGQPPNPVTVEATIAGFVEDKANLPLLRKWAATVDPRVTGQLVYEDLMADLRSSIGTIGTPVTVVFPWTEANPRELAEPFYRMQYAALPHARFVPVGPAGHFLMLDKPAEFTAALEAFLSAKGPARE